MKFMASKSQVIRENTGAGVQTVKASPIIPNGKIWVVSLFGAADIDLGDNMSSYYVLQWGSGATFEDIRILALTGATQEVKLNKEFVGDGVKFLRVIMKNNSGSAKDLAFWYNAYER